MNGEHQIKFNNHLVVLWLFAIMMLYVVNYFVNLIFSTTVILSFIYLIEVGMILVGGVVLIDSFIFKNKRFSPGFLFFLISFVFLFVLQIANNLVRDNYGALSDLLKWLLYVIVFYVSFINFKEHRSKLSYGVERYLIFIPFLVLIIDAFLYKGQHGGVSSIFYNSNNAAYYAVVTSIIFIKSKSFKLFWFYLLISFIILMKLGAFVAIILSTTIFLVQKIRLKRRHILPLTILTLVLLIVLYLGNNIGLFSRFFKVADHFLILLDQFSISEIANLSYGEAISVLKDPNADLSFLFRIKQTFELTSTFINSSLSEILFGLGVGSVPLNSSNGLVAHNDYVTILFEYGLVAFILFSVPQLYFLYLIRKEMIFIPICAIVIYFFLENLYFNFLATSLYFFFMGNFWAKKKYGQL